MNEQTYEGYIEKQIDQKYRKINKKNYKNLKTFI